MIYTINQNLTVECKNFNNKTGWGHTARLYRDGVAIANKKIVYQNRTWERYEYESILLAIAGNKKLTPSEKDQFNSKIYNQFK